MRFPHRPHATPASHEESAGTATAHGRLRAFLPLYLVIYVAYLGYAMTVTIFVPMMMDESLGFVPKDTPRGVRTVLAGVLMALYPIGQFFGAPVLGALSDRYGRKRVLLASLSAGVLLYAVVCLALQLESLPLLMASCFCVGLSEADVAIAQSSIADRTTPDHAAGSSATSTPR